MNFSIISKLSSMKKALIYRISIKNQLNKLNSFNFSNKLNTDKILNKSEYTSTGNQKKLFVGEEEQTSNNNKKDNARRPDFSYINYIKSEDYISLKEKENEELLNLANKPKRSFFPNIRKLFEKPNKHLICYIPRNISLHLTIFTLGLFPVLNVFCGLFLMKSILTLKVIKSVFFSCSFIGGLIFQRLLFFYRKLIVREIYINKHSDNKSIINIKLMNGRVIKDDYWNVKIKYLDNDYVTPDYVFTSQDVNKISYFIVIQDEEFYIPRRLIKVNDLELYKSLLSGNMQSVFI